MKQIKSGVAAIALIAVALFAAGCQEIGTEETYNINIGMGPETEPLFVPVQQMKDSILLVGPNSPKLQPAPEEIEDFLFEKASTAGWNDYQLLFSHLVTSLDDYDNYFVLAEYEKEGQRHMEGGIVGIYVGGDKKGTIDYRADTFSPGLRTISYRDRAVQLYRLQHLIKHTPGGMYLIRFGVITDPDVEQLEMEFAYGRDWRNPHRKHLGRFTLQLDADEYPCFLLILSETHGPPGDKPVRGFPHGHIRLTEWTALDGENEEVDSRTR